MADIMDSLKWLGSGDMSHRNDVFNTDVANNQVVDTVLPRDTNKWETGVERKGVWYIVEQYDSREEAKVGHDSWVESLNSDPEQKLVDVLKPQFAESMGITLDPEECEG
jgi:hypothetical protein